MNYLDAAIGFTVVMAIFAGAATAITEVIKRWQRTKARNLLTVLNGLQQKMLSYKGVELSAAQRYELLRSIVNNPLEQDSQGIPEVTANASDADLEQAIVQLTNNKPPKRIFNRVSTEHVCRRTAEALFVAGVPVDDIEKALARIARDFDMLISSVSTKFQDHFRGISIAAGMLIALFFNVNAFRILDTFIQDPELARSIAAQMQDVEQQAEENLTAAHADIEAGLQELETMTHELRHQGLPIGAAFEPHRSIKASCLVLWPGQPCLQAWWDGAVDILVLVLTGALLGLGAPFWFDVAKRLATVRSWFGGTPSAAEAKAGRDAGTTSEDRKKLAREIVADLED